MARVVGNMYSFLTLVLQFAAFALLLTGCATGSEPGPSSTAAASPLLIPAQTILGGRLAVKHDQNGFPDPNALKGFATLIYPVALAARNPDLYIADAGARKIYRFSPSLQSLSVVPGVLASPQTRLQVAADLSLLVLDPSSSVITRYARGGQKLQTLPPQLGSSHLTEFWVEEALGRIYATDQLNQQVVPMHPLGTTYLPLITAGAGNILTPGALTGAGHTLYALDTGCVCIAAIDESGQVRERIGQGELMQPRALVADRAERLYIADAFDHTLKIFQRGSLIAHYSARDLHALELSALAIDQDTLYIADAPGAKVLSFRIRQP